MTQRIILNLISNEDDPKIVQRCLRSIKPFLDAWVICDNGSTQEVRDEMLACLGGIPGVLSCVPWVDFGTNKTQALELALQYATDRFPGDECYVFLIDCDEEFVSSDGYLLPNLNNGDMFGFRMITEGVVYPRPNLLNLKRKWWFDGPMHEKLSHDGDAPSLSVLEGAHILVRQDGKRSKDLGKYWKDAETLRVAFEKDPRPRYKFYQAQALRGARLYVDALEAYCDYIAIADDYNEKWYSLLQSGRIMDECGNFPPEKVEHTFLCAYEMKPRRKEALASLAIHWRNRNKPNLALWASERALGLQQDSNDIFFLETFWDFLLLEEVSRNAFAVGEYAKCANACRELLKRKGLSYEEIKRIEANLKSVEALELNPKLPASETNT